MKKRKPISEQLRDAIRNADISRYEISNRTGMTQASRSRFMNRVTGLSLESIDKLGECLELDVVGKPSGKKGSK